jgi:flagellar motor switch/type III secretory pathway protein FliN
MAMHARYVARYTRSKEQKYRDHHLNEFTKWETITAILSDLGAVASHEEHQERKEREKKHKEYMEACDKDAERVLEKLRQPLVVESGAKEHPLNNLLNDQIKLYYGNSANFTYIPSTTTTTGTTWKFTIPRDENSKVAALPQPGPAQGSQMVEEQEVEGIV